MAAEIPAGWYPNPWNDAEELYWSGAEWTGISRAAHRSGPAVAPPVLDEIEEVYPGVEGLFRGHDVTLDVDGTAVACRFYPVAKEAVAGLKEIASGDWIAHHRGR